MDFHGSLSTDAKALAEPLMGEFYIKGLLK